MPASTTDLCDLTARELASLILRKKVSAREVMTAHLTRIDQVNPALNAIVTLTAESALDGAAAADATLATGGYLGPLHGLPIAHKDLFVTAGIRTTFGSRVFSDHVPDNTALIVERARRAGAITIGKTNTPELGAGSQTFNEVFGATLNPYDPTKTCGGSESGALALDALAGPDARAPLSLPLPRGRFSSALDRDLRDVRVAWSADLGGLPVQPAVTQVLDRQRTVFETLGCVTDDDAPDLSGADEIFTTWRAWYFELAFGSLLDAHREQLKDTVVWNIEAGRALSGPQIAEAERKRAMLQHRVRRFLERYEFLLCPVTQVVPFDVTQPYVTHINDQPLPTYLDWMKSCYQISVTGLPAISVPCGFTDDGLPVGLQIVGRPFDDLGVLQLAHAFERATGFWKRRPPAAPLGNKGAG
jgi:amidase